MASVNVRPLGDRVLVQATEEKETKKGGIIIPDSAKEKPQEGKIVATGPGKFDESGKRIPLDVKKGEAPYRYYIATEGQVKKFLKRMETDTKDVKEEEDEEEEGGKKKKKKSEEDE